MRRIMGLFGIRRENDAGRMERIVQSVLSSRSLRESLQIRSTSRDEATTGNRTNIGPSNSELMPMHADPESGLSVSNSQAIQTTAAAAHEATESAVLVSYLRIAVDVHPFGNPHSDASLAFRWVSEAFSKLRSSDNFEDAEGAPLFERQCSISFDEAFEVFNETVTSTYDRLSLHDLAVGGISKPLADYLLRGLHILHTHPLQGRSDDNVFFDSVLYGSLATNWLLEIFSRLFTIRRGQQRAQRLCSTTVAALGGIAFGGANRLRRMMLAETPNGTTPNLEATWGLNNASPFVRCPLCRTGVSTRLSIRNVHAGETPPMCCVCTEMHSSVCLPCGHLCLCEECFARLPRFTGS